MSTFCQNDRKTAYGSRLSLFVVRTSRHCVSLCIIEQAQKNIQSRKATPPSSTYITVLSSNTNTKQDNRPPASLFPSRESSTPLALRRHRTLTTCSTILQHHLAYNTILSFPSYHYYHHHHQDAIPLALRSSRTRYHRHCQRKRKDDSANRIQGDYESHAESRSQRVHGESERGVGHHGRVGC